MYFYIFKISKEKNRYKNKYAKKFAYLNYSFYICILILKMKRYSKIYRQILRAYMISIGGTIISENERHTKFKYKDIEVLIITYNTKAFTAFIGDEVMVSKSYSFRKAVIRFKKILHNKC